MRQPVVVVVTTVLLRCAAASLSVLVEQKPIGTGRTTTLSTTHEPCDYGCDQVSVADDALETCIEHLMEKWHVPGLAIAIVDGNKTWAKGFGEAKIGSEPVTPSTLFYAGSTTKSFTAAAVSLLVDESENYSSIAWDSPLVEFLRDDWLLGSEWATNHVTIEDALSHRTGYPRHDFSRVPPSSSEMVRNFRNLPMSAEPRVKFQYNNLMFGTVGYLVAKLTGSWLGEFFRERLWEPMGMKSTYLSLRDAESSGQVLADEHRYNNDTDAYDFIPHSQFAWSEGAGMTISNVIDYSRYLRVMMAESAPLSKAGHRALKTARAVVGTKELMPFTGPVWYCLGWFGGVFAGEEVWFHSGQVNGHVTNMIMIPARNFAVVNMQNAESFIVEVIPFKILYDFLKVGPDKRVDMEKRHTAKLEQQDYLLKTSRERLYPSLPSPPIRRPVSIESYVGLYHHAGYGTFNVTLDCVPQELPKDSPASPTTTDDGCRLTMMVPQRQGEEAGNIRLDLEHMTGDYWVGWAYMTHFHNYRHPMACQRVEFRVNASGVVASVGVDARMEGEDVPLIWSERVTS